MIKDLYDDQEKTNTNILDNISPVVAKRLSYNPVGRSQVGSPKSILKGTSFKENSKSFFKIEPKKSLFGRGSIQGDSDDSDSDDSDSSEDSDIDEIIEQQIKAANSHSNESKGDPSSILPKISRKKSMMAKKDTPSSTGFVNEQPAVSNFGPGEFGFTLAPAKKLPMIHKPATGLRPNFKTSPYEPMVKEYKRDPKDNDRVLEAHKKNVANYPNLYRGDDNEADEFKGEKGGAKLFKDDINNIDSGIITENALNYFFKSVEDKQRKMDGKVLDKYQLRAFIFTTDFFRKFA